MTRAPRKGWWYRASIEQRLAQIDGGVECGLTARQVAMVSGVDMDRHPAQVVASFAIKHGRHFPNGRFSGVQKTGLRIGGIKRDRSQYLRGNNVDFWNGDAHGDPVEVEEVSF